MLDLNGSSYQLCDGLNRRSFLKLGGLAMGGISLEQLLRAEAAASSSGVLKSTVAVRLHADLSVTCQPG